ncbi:hypothetical protein [Luteipulveratus mongoliensis]|uniref:Uncharacterized protein n=1 Tax=Luteipulveratus mongoliensis TaxID=571913 RepID=A0A0K1JIW1_9MICO|nr:hypothetical protein [Luteipulveratus mongoliensis]AKU16520.1 hypothetical protein VV02_12700 [Luteipulveratus mongoliensis]
MSTPSPESTDVARLRRWTDFGGQWRVIEQGSGTATVSLCRCDGPEVERFVTEDAAALAYLSAEADDS